MANMVNAGADVGGGCGGCAPPPPRDDLRFSNTTGILQKLCGLLVLKQNKRRVHPLLKKILDPPLKCHICLVIYTPCFLVCKCGIHSSVFTYLRHICKEQICANPFFSVQWKNRGRANIFSLKRARRICALCATCVVNVHIFHPNLQC